MQVSVRSKRMRISAHQPKTFKVFWGNFSKKRSAGFQKAKMTAMQRAPQRIMMGIVVRPAIFMGQEV